MSCGDGAVPDGAASDDAKRVRPAASELHPFFMPQAKRPKQKALDGQPSAEKRVRKPKGGGGAAQGTQLRASKIQSFFKVRLSQAGALAPEEQPCEPANQACIALELSDGEAPVAVHAEPETEREPRPMQLRALLRTATPVAGIPAPLPSEHTHVPFPVYRAFEARGCQRKSSRVSAESIAGAGGHALSLRPTHMSVSESGDGGCSQWQRDIGASRFWHTSSRHPGSHDAMSADRARIRATPARVHLGRGVPLPSAHLQFVDPLLRLLCQGGQQGSSLLLSSKYRPKRARDVLDNQRAVHQLHSWIEGMRLRRAAAPPALAAPTRRRPKPRRAAAGDGNPGSSATDGDGGSSSDDFMPSNIRAKPRRANRADGPGDMLAWAQSNGTHYSSVHERAGGGLSRHRRQASSAGSGSGSESESFSNVILLEGPSGSCKTAAVYACAEECGFGVCEIHPGQRRSGKDVLALLEDVVLSHTITAPSGNPSLVGNSGDVNQVLILIEQVDVLFEQDQRLWPALKQLALKSRRPIVLTCSSMSCVRWDAACFHAVLRFVRPSERSLVPYCFLMCLAEGVLTSPTDLARACRELDRDINRLLCLLEITVMETSAPPGVDALAQQTLDLGGTLAWLFSPLESGETPESRYLFWSELLSSVQPDAAPCWYGLWPEPPPPLYDDEPPLPPSHAMHQNSYFSLPASAAPDLCAETEQLALASVSYSSRPALCVSVAAAIPDLSLWLPAASGAKTATAGGCLASECDQLSAVALALDTLSLARATTSATEQQTECLCEPLYAHSAPLADGCLDVCYITLDSDVLTRRNGTFLPDSVNVGQCTGAEIDACLRASALALLGSATGTESACRGLDRSMRAREQARPHSSATLLASGGNTQHRLQRALELVCARNLRCAQPVLVETASYLARMVAWDWLHQGRAAGGAGTGASSGDGSDLIFRATTRRTRLNTYRPHIKSVPESLQAFLTSWASLNRPSHAPAPWSASVEHAQERV